MSKKLIIASYFSLEPKDGRDLSFLHILLYLGRESITIKLPSRELVKAKIHHLSQTRRIQSEIDNGRTSLGRKQQQSGNQSRGS